jgi:uncharacterized protein
MKVGITGASGFIGSRVEAHCRKRGIEAIGFSRHPGAGARRFELTSVPDIGDLDVIVNLAGEPIFGFWTEEKKRRIRESRILGTRRVVEAIAKAGRPPSVLVNASAIGFYGDTGEKVADESSPSGNGFLAEVCREWEAEATRAKSFGVRVVLVRIGFVIGKGGALKLVRPLFKLGLGGRLGSGRQWMSGVHVDDVAGIIIWALENKGVHGPVNAVMREPFRNLDFTRELARCLGRPAVVPAPRFALRLAFGELASSMLESVRVVPRVAREAGYQYQFASLQSALAEATK